MTLSKAARASLFGLNLSSTMLISPFMFEFVKLSMLETSMLCSASCMTLSKVARAISFSGEENRGSPISVSSSWGGGAGALDFCLFCLLRSPTEKKDFLCLHFHWVISIPIVFIFILHRQQMSYATMCRNGNFGLVFGRGEILLTYMIFVYHWTS